MTRFRVTMAALSLVAGVPLFVVSPAHAQDDLHTRYSTRMNANDYLWGSFPDRTDDIFDHGKTIDLSVNLGVGSDCGRIDFEGTLKSTLQNLLDTRYFGNVGKDVIAGSPMLLACYFSPTWCSILKHTQVNANLLSKSRLDQCALIDKYTDQRVEDFQRERQDCVRQQIQANGGDLERALGSCKNTWTMDLKSWAGPSYGSTPVNQLIESSAQWAGLLSPSARKTLNLVKSLVGDTMVSKGVVTVQYGPDNVIRTPRTHLIGLQNEYHDLVCADLISNVESAAKGESLNELLSASDVQKLEDEWGNPLIDRQTLESLNNLPPQRQRVACRKLSDAIAATIFARDLNRAVDVVNTLSQNPNLPPHRQQELREKARTLGETTSLTMQLERHRNGPLNEVLAQINLEGEQSRRVQTSDTFRNNAAHVKTAESRSFFFDCADGIMCQ